MYTQLPLVRVLPNVLFSFDASEPSSLLVSNENLLVKWRSLSGEKELIPTVSNEATIVTDTSGRRGVRIRSPENVGTGDTTLNYLRESGNDIPLNNHTIVVVFSFGTIGTNDEDRTIILARRPYYDAVNGTSRFTGTIHIRRQGTRVVVFAASINTAGTQHTNATTSFNIVSHCTVALVLQSTMTPQKVRIQQIHRLTESNGWTYSEAQSSETAQSIPDTHAESSFLSLGAIRTLDREHPVEGNNSGLVIHEMTIFSTSFTIHALWVLLGWVSRKWKVGS